MMFLTDVYETGVRPAVLSVFSSSVFSSSMCSPAASRVERVASFASLIGAVGLISYDGDVDSTRGVFALLVAAWGGRVRVCLNCQRICCCLWWPWRGTYCDAVLSCVSVVWCQSCALSRVARGRLVRLEGRLRMRRGVRRAWGATWGHHCCGSTSANIEFRQRLQIFIVTLHTNTAHL